MLPYSLQCSVEIGFRQQAQANTLGIRMINEVLCLDSGAMTPNIHKTRGPTG